MSGSNPGIASDTVSETIRRVLANGRGLASSYTFGGLGNGVVKNILPSVDKIIPRLTLLAGSANTGNVLIGFNGSPIYPLAPGDTVILESINPAASNLCVGDGTVDQKGNVLYWIG